MKFYFTFGTGPYFPYYGGWVEVIAEDRDAAFEKFRKKFPDFNKGVVNCASIYPETAWFKTSMAKTGGNYGKGCHEIIE